jgi:hypothetical protein
MKKILTLIACILLISCDDGDFDVPAFEFGETVYNCPLKDNSYTLFRLSDSEALIIIVTTSQIKNEVSATPITTSINSSNVVYRTFNGDVSESYFCEDIPPLAPSVLSNWTGVTGDSSAIIIETTEELDNTNTLTGYKHTIRFQNLTLENGNSSLVYAEELFGSFITSL